MDPGSFDTAVSFLHKELSPNIIGQLKSSNIDRIEQNFALGMMVRNALRRSDVTLDDVWLDDNWFEVLQEVIKQT